MLLFSVHVYHGHSLMANICWSSDLKQTLFAVHIRLKIAENVRILILYLLARMKYTVTKR